MAGKRGKLKPEFVLLVVAALLSFAYAASLVSAGKSLSDVPYPPSILSASLAVSNGIPPAATSASAQDMPAPSILSASVEPEKVRPGDSMLVSAQVSDPSGVSQVSADMGGIETIPLSLASGTIYNGTWRALWLVHDTEPIDYTTLITATNRLGASSNKTLAWSDPVFGWGYPELLYRRPVSISNPGPALTDYQVPINLTTALYNNTGLVGSWHFSEGSGQAAADSSGSGNNGQLGSSSGSDANDPTWTASGKFGRGLTFDGNDYVSVPDTAVLKPTEVTAEAWIKTTMTANGGAVLAKGKADGQSYLLVQNAISYGGAGVANKMTFTTYTATGWKSASSANSTNDGNWHHVVGTANGTTVSIYVDGVLENTVAGGAIDYTTPYPFAIGAYQAGASSLTNYFDGTIDEVRIYSRALSQQEIQEHYNATKSRLDYADLRFSQPYAIYETPISITGTGSNLTDYQVLINISNSTILSHMRGDGADLRFFAGQTSTPYSQSTLPYWIENISSTRALVWVKANVSSSGSTLYMYYGNVSAGAQSNGTATFDFFDDFEDGTFDTTKWYYYAGSGATEAGGYLAVPDNVVVATVRNFSVNTALELDYSPVSSTSSYAIASSMPYYSSEGGHYYCYAGTANCMQQMNWYWSTAYMLAISENTTAHQEFDMGDYAYGTWYKASIVWAPATVLYRMNQYAYTITSNVPSSSSTGMKVMLTDRGNFDNIRVRKYSSTAPNATLGSETVKSSNEAPIPYWLESDNQAWVKVPSLPANASATVYMYYGNVSAGNQSNITAVFPQTTTSTGGTITYLSNYAIHTFASSGTFTPFFNGTVGIVVIGGGGGGQGSYCSGCGCTGPGGGSGGINIVSNVEVIYNGGVAVTVGAGGAGSSVACSVNPPGGNGGTSSFGAYSATGGIGGGPGTGGTPGGFAGGNPTGCYFSGQAGPGGGGTAGPGVNGSGTSGGPGGGGNGYGGAGGNGGGGSGGVGGGGGAGGSCGAGGSGGAGIVVVSYVNRKYSSPEPIVGAFGAEDSWRLSVSGSLSPPLANPGDAVNLTGRALFYDGTPVSNNWLNLYLNGVQQGGYSGYMSGAASWLNPAWPYRTPITLNGSASPLTDYQVPLNLTAAIYNNSGLVGSWHFSEGSGTSAADSSGNGNTGTLTNFDWTASSNWTAGKFGGGLRFDGSNDYVSAPVSLPATATFEMWATWGGTQNVMLFNAGPNGAGPDLFFWSGNIYWNFWVGGGYSFGAIPANANDGNFHHYVVIAQSGNTRLYYDGSLLGTATYVSPTGNTFVVGGGGNSDYSWGGKIDEVRVYNRALSQQEIQEHYNATKARLDYQDLRFSQPYTIYETPISITGTGSALTNYQVLINITNSTILSHMRADGADLRFFAGQTSTPYSQATLPYWIENISSSRALVWVRANVSAGGSTIYLYYGNVSAGAQSNGSATFEFFDDFESGSFNSGKWPTVGGSSAVNTLHPYSGAYSAYYGFAGLQSNVWGTLGDKYELQFRHYDTGAGSRSEEWAGLSASSGGGDLRAAWGYTASTYAISVGTTDTGVARPGAGNWAKIKLIYAGGTTNYYSINDAANTVLTGNAGGVDKLAFGYGWGNDNGATWIDDVRVRKYSSPEPNATLGSESVKSSGLEAPLSYWLESDNQAWVKFLSLPANANSSVFMYYGNPAVNSTSNGSATFEFFDDFVVDGWTDTPTSGQEIYVDTGNKYLYIKGSRTTTDFHTVKSVGALTNFILTLDLNITGYSGTGGAIYLGLADADANVQTSIQDFLGIQLYGYAIQSKVLVYAFKKQGGAIDGQDEKGITSFPTNCGVTIWRLGNTAHAEMVCGSTTTTYTWTGTNLGDLNYFIVSNMNDETRAGPPWSTATSDNWLLRKYSSPEPSVLSMGAMQAPLFTDSSGNYSYSFAAPSYGTYLVKVNITSPDGRYGESTTSLKVNAYPSVQSLTISNSTLGQSEPYYMGSQVRIRANISDLNGYSDISSVLLNLSYPNGSLAVANTQMNFSYAIDANASLYEYNYTLPNVTATKGAWNAAVWAVDSSSWAGSRAGAFNATTCFGTENADLSVSGTVQMIGSCTYRNVNISGTLTTVQGYGLNLTASNLTIFSGGKIDVSGKGYGDGLGPGAGGAATYGSITAPNDLGSGGTTSGTGPGGPGGGLAKLNISGTLTNNGSIIANGVNGVIGSTTGGGVNGGGGGGSGGTIYLSAGTLAGSGSITANGGAGGGGGDQSGSGTGGSYGGVGGAGYMWGAPGGGGAGGRIAIRYNAKTFTGAITAVGGTGYNAGQNGSAYQNFTTLSVDLNDSAFGVPQSAYLTFVGHAGKRSWLVNYTANIVEDYYNYTGSQVNLYLNGAFLGSATTDTYGNYNYSFAGPANFGTYTLKALHTETGMASTKVFIVNAYPQVDSVSIYNSTLGQSEPYFMGSIIRIRANVSDLNGYSDINKVLLTLNYPNGDIPLVNAPMSFVSSIDANTSIYEYTYTLPSVVDTKGAWIARVSANDTSDWWSAPSNSSFNGTTCWGTEGADVSISSTIQMIGACSYRNVDVSGTLTTVQGYGLNLTAANLTILSGGRIDVSGLGFAGGGEPNPGVGPGGGMYGQYGGGGAYGSYGGGSTGGVYGSIVSPSDLGSGGGSAWYGVGGGSGGGAVFLNVSRLVLNGSLLANGAGGGSTPGGSGSAGGSGSGGSVWIIAGNLSGNGTIRAIGGSGCGARCSYGGGGGRIAIQYGNKNDFTGIIEAYGGATGAYGGAGTVYLKSVGQAYGELIVDNAGNSGASTPLNESGVFSSLQVRNKSVVNILQGKTITLNSTTLDIYAGSYLTVYGGLNAENVNSLVINGTFTITNSTTTVFSSLRNVVVGPTGTLTHLPNANNKTYFIALNSENITVLSGGRIDVSGLGFAGGGEPNPGVGPGGGAPGQYGGGGSYGGYGGGSTGVVYGSVVSPLDLGSGGGSAWYGVGGGSGGGAVFLNVSRLVLNGSLLANGAGGGSTGGGVGSAGGGGSGGSIWVVVGNLSGNGTVQAVGGGGCGSRCSHSGGGGRIAVYYLNKTGYVGTIGAYGWNTNAIGGAGTIYLKSAYQTYGDLTVDNNGASGASTPLNSSAYPTVFDRINVSNGALLSSAIPTLLLNSTVLLGNGRVSVDSNTIVLRASNISLNLSSTTGQLNITTPGNFTPSRSITTSSGSIKIWYGSSPYDYCDVSGATISAGAQFYFSPYSTTVPHKCARLLLDQFSVLDSANNQRMVLNKNEGFYPSARIREYDSHNGLYLNPGGSWNLSVYASTGSVPNGKYALSNVTSFLWRAQAFSENSMASYSFYANLSGASAVGMRADSSGLLYNYSVKTISVSESLIPAIANPGEGVNVSGQATLLLDGTPVASNQINMFLDGQQINISTLDKFCADGTIARSCGWQYRKAIAVNGSTYALFDYQVRITLNSSSFNFSRANAQGNDTRFTWLNTSSGLEQNASFWIENWTASGSNGNATLWVKVPGIAANTSTTLYMYYGNPAANSTSNVTNTLLLWDEFEGASGSQPNPSLWKVTRAGNCNLNAYAKTELDGTGIVKLFNPGGGPCCTSAAIYVSSLLDFDDVSFEFLITTLTGNWYPVGVFYVNADQFTDGVSEPNTYYKVNHQAYNSVINAFQSYNGGSTEQAIGSSAGLGVQPTNYYKIRAYGTNVTVLHSSDGQNWIEYVSGLVTNDLPAGKIGWRIGTACDRWSDLRISNVRIRKYSSPEPFVLSVGAEQTPAMTNSTGGYSYSFSPPQTAGVHNARVNLTNPSGIYGENSTNLSVRIPLANPTAKGLRTGTEHANPSEDVNLSVYIPPSNIGSVKLDRVRVVVTKPDLSTQTVFLNGNSSGGNWSGLFTSTSLFGNYSAVFYANLTDGFSLTQNASVKFYVQTVSVSEGLDPLVANPGGNVTVTGQATLLPEGMPVANNNINIFLDGQPANNWQYRKPITVNGSSSTLTDYQVQITLNSSSFNFSKANAQGNDMRFTWLNTSSGLEQNASFWIETWTASGENGNATIWVKIPNIAASTVANTMIYMYYGNLSAVNQSNITDVFPQTTTSTGGTITYSSNYAIHTFTSSGTFTSSFNGSVYVTAVGGGGGGGGGQPANTAGRGGSGGSTNITVNGFTVVTSAGGAGGAPTLAGAASIVATGSPSILSNDVIVVNVGGGGGGGCASGSVAGYSCATSSTGGGNGSNGGNGYNATATGAIGPCLGYGGIGTAGGGGGCGANTAAESGGGGGSGAGGGGGGGSGSAPSGSGRDVSGDAANGTSSSGSGGSGGRTGGAGGAGGGGGGGGGSSYSGGGGGGGGNASIRYINRKYASPEPSVLSVGAEQATTTTNSTGGYSYNFSAPQAAGSHTLKVNLTDPNGIYGENSTNLSVRIPLTNPNAKGIATSNQNININESANLSVYISPSNIGSDNLSKVWANVSWSSGKQTVHLSGSALGGTWSGLFSNTSKLDTYNVTFFANLSSGFSIVTNASAQFFVKALNITAAYDNIIYDSEASVFSGTVYREPEHSIAGSISQQNSFSDGSFSNGTHSGTKNSSGLQLQYSGFQYRRQINVSNPASALTDYQIPLNLTSTIYNNSGLVGSWHFSEGSGTSAADSSGNGNTGTLTGFDWNANSNWTAGKFGGGLKFDGSNDAVDLGLPSSLMQIGAVGVDFTILAWVKPSVIAEQQIYNSRGADYNARLQFQTDGTNNLGAGKYDGVSCNKGGYGTRALAAGAWSFVGVSYSSSNQNQAILYIDGAGENLTISGFGSCAPIPSAITIGAGKKNSGYFTHFNGNIDEVRIYNRSLSAQEIQEHYNATKARLDYADLRFSQPYTIYETPISITGTGSALTDYQVLINITNQTILSHMRADGADLRFFANQTSTPYSQSTLPYWIENISSSRALVWVKTNVSASGSTLYMYYGNVSAGAQSNGTNTFVPYVNFANTIGTASYTGGSCGYPASNAVDNNVATHWNSCVYALNWIQITLSSQKSISSILYPHNVFATYSGNADTQYYNYDTSAWVTLDTHSYVGDVDEFNLSVNFNSVTSDKFRLIAISGTPNMKIFEFQISDSVLLYGTLGRKYSSPEPNATVGSESVKSSGLEAPLSYWLESDNQAWVKVPSLPAGANSTVNMYYGNPAANSTSNGSATFIGFADFNTDEGYTWVENGAGESYGSTVGELRSGSNRAELAYSYANQIEDVYKSIPLTYNFFYEGKVYWNSGASNPGGWQVIAISDGTATPYVSTNTKSIGINFDPYPTHLSVSIFAKDGSGSTIWDAGTSIDGGSWTYWVVLTRLGTTVTLKFYTDQAKTSLRGQSTLTLTPGYDNSFTHIHPIYYDAYDPGKYVSGYVDDIRIRKYSSPEPSPLIGAEQYTPASGNYLSAGYAQAYPILSITPVWSAGGNVSVEISANNGTEWITAGNGNSYSSGAGIGTGSILRYRINLSADGSALPVFSSLTLNYTIVQPLYLQANATGGSVPNLILTGFDGAYQFTYAPQNESAITYRTIYLNATDFDGIRGNRSGQIKVYPDINARVISDYDYYNLGETVKLGAYLEFNGSEVTPRELAVAQGYLMNNSNGSEGSTGLGISNHTTFSGSMATAGTTNPSPPNTGEWTAWTGTEANYSRRIGSKSLRVNPFKLNVDTLPAAEAKPGQNYTVRILQKNTYDNAGTTLLNSNATLYFRSMSHAVPTDVQNSIPSDPAECPNGMRVESGCGGYYRIIVNATVNATGGLVLNALKETEFFVDYPYWDSNYTDLTFRPYRVRVTVDNRFGYAREYLVEVNGSQLASSGATLSQIRPSSIRVVDPDKAGTQEEVWGAGIPYNITSTAGIGAADRIRWLANLSENSRKAFYVYYTTTETNPPQYAGISGTKHPNVSLKYEKSDVLIMLVTYNLEPPIYRRGESINASLLFYTPHPAQTAIYYYLYGPGGEYQYVPWYAPGSISQEWNSLSRLIPVGSNASFGEWRIKFQVTDQQDGKSSTYEKKFWVGQVEVSETVSPNLVNVNEKAVVEGSVIEAASSTPLPGVDVNLTISGPAFRNLSGEYEYLKKVTVQTGVVGAYQYNYTPTIPGEYSIGAYVNVNGNRGYNSTNLSVRLTVNVSVDIPVPVTGPYAPVDVLVAVDNNGDSVENVSCGYYYSGVEAGSLPSKSVSINPRAYSPANNIWDILPNRVGDYRLDVNCSHWAYQAGFGYANFSRYNLSLYPSLDTIYVQEPFALSGNLSRSGAGLNGTVYLAINGSEYWAVNATAGNGSYSKNGLVLQKPGYYNLSAVYVSPNGKGVAFAGLHVRYYADSAVGVDSESYKANSLVNISLASTNFANVSWNPVLQFRVFNASVNVSNWTESFSFSPLGAVSYGTVWNTSHTPPGSYNVSVVLVDPEGLGASFAEAGFAINTTIGAVLSASLDGLDYNMSRLVNVSGLVERTGNVEVAGSFGVRVENMDSGCLYCGYCGLVYGIDNLSVSTEGGAYPFAYLWNTSTRHSGNYMAFASFNYTDEYGAVRVLNWNRSFVVNSNPLLVVSLSVNKAVFNVSDTITANVSIENVGNAYTIGSLWMNVTDSSGVRRVSSPDFFTGDDTTRVLCNRVAGGNSDFKSYSMGLSQTDFSVPPNFVAGFREEGNYSFRATVDYSGRRAWDERNISVLGYGSVSASGFEVWYYPEFGKVYANQNVGMNLKVENKGNLYFRNMTVDYLVYCSNLSGAGSVRAYSSFNQSGVDRFDLPVSTAGRFSGASWNSAHTPVNKSAGSRACSANALLWTPVIYASCPCVSGGVCYWWASSSLVAGCDFGASQASSFTLYATYSAAVNVSGGGVFGAGDMVLFNLSVNNSGNVPLNGSLVAGLYSGSSLLVNGSCNNGSLPLDVDGAYARSCELELVNVLSGNYSLKAVYSFDGGSTSSGSVPVEVLGQVKGRINASMDRSSVDMGGTLNISGWAKNTGNLLLTGVLELKAIGYENRSISSESVSLSMGQLYYFNRSWNVGTLSSGAYALRASLNYSTENGSRVAFTDVPFTVNSLVRVNVSMNLSNLSLGALEVLSVNASMANTGNYLFNNLDVLFSVVSFNGSTVYSASSPISGFWPNASASKAFSWSTAQYPPGAYRVIITAKNASWNASESGNLTVLETKRVAVRISTSKATYLEGEPVDVKGNVTSTGNVKLYGSFNLTLQNEAGTNVDVTEAVWRNRSIDVGEVFSFSKRYSAASRDYGKPLALAVSEGVLPISLYTASATYSHAQAQNNSTYFVVGGISIKITPPAYPAHTLRKFESSLNIIILGANVTGLDAVKSYIKSLWFTKDGVNWIGDGIDYTQQAKDSFSSLGAMNYSMNITAPSEKGTYSMCMRMQDDSGREGIGCAGVDVSYYAYTVGLVTSSGEVQNIGRGVHTDLQHKYVSVLGSGFASGLVFGGSDFYNVYWNDCGANRCIGLTQEVIGGKAVIPFTIGSEQNLRERMALIEAGEFWSQPNPSFAYPLGGKYRVKVAVRYPNLILNGTESFPQGSYEVVIANKGKVNGTPVIGVTTR